MIANRNDTILRPLMALLLAWMIAPSVVGAGEDMLEASGVQGGVAVHVGQVDKLTVAMTADERFLVHGLDTNRAKVTQARQDIRSLGLYGRVSVDTFNGSDLPYRDNMVNLIVIRDARHEIRGGEIERVLAPRGVAIIHEKNGDLISRIPYPASPIGDGFVKFVKPVPGDIDDWTHYLHGPGNNAVSGDKVVGPPGQLQWKGGPEWARHHDHQASTVAMVSAGGRLFYIMDDGPISSIQLPPRWFLVARDAFNGKILWKRRIKSWWPHLWPNKKGFGMSPRRLVAESQTVYCTMGLNAPLTALDAATGSVIRTYPKSFVTEEFVLSGDTLFLVVTDHVREPDDQTPELMRFRAESWIRDTTRTRVAAINKETGAELWRAKYPVQQMTLAADAERVYFHDGERIIALDRKTGKRLWKSSPIPRAPDRYSSWFGSTLVVYENVVLFAGGENVQSHRGGRDTMTAVSATDGKTLWNAPHPASGYDSPEDLFVIDDLVWFAPLTNRRDTGQFSGYDLNTGEVKRQYPDTTGAHMPHHRCHRSKATEKYILTSRTGIEFVDVQGNEERTRHDWVRGGCLYGILPANGLIYTPPHACACYILAKLSGFCALAPAAESRVKGQESRAEDPLERGPAYEQIGNQKSQIENPNDWPMYRHDPARSGASATRVPSDVRILWDTDLGGPLTAPVISDGKCFVASVDAHTVHAVDAGSGKTLWRFTAGGRIDSPPTIKGNRLVFGCRDGWVYCLRVADGAVIWRFRAAPADRRLVACEQIESLWPVHGSVLIHESEVHCTAGRSMFLEGGIRYLRLDLHTGKLIAEHVMDDRHPVTRKKLDDNIRWPNLPTARQDLLSFDGQNFYLRTQAFDRDGKRTFEQCETKPHLFSSIGLLDASWWHRSYWIYGTSMSSGAGGWPKAGQEAPAGRILVFDEDKTFGFRRNKEHFSALAVTSWMEHHLFAMKKQPKLSTMQINEPEPLGRKRRVSTPNELWSSAVPMMARAMVLTPEALFVAGPPDLLDEGKSNANLNDPQLRARAAEQAEAWLGNKGGVLLAVSAASGETVTEYKLDAPPVFDGMAAANGRLYVSLENGSVVSYGEAP